MLDNLLRALSSPLGYLIAGYLKETMGDSAYLVGSTISSSLVEWVISLKDKIPIGEWWQRYRPQPRYQTLSLTDPITISHLSRWLQNEHRDQVTGFTINPEGRLVITGLRHDAQIRVQGVRVQLSYDKEVIVATYPQRETDEREILDAIRSHVPQNIALRTYTWHAGWRLTEDILTCNRDNTFYTEEVETRFVQDVDRFLETIPGTDPNPHKRNYLLWGLPGSGKTSIVRSVLGHLRVFRIGNHLLHHKEDFLNAVSSIREHVTTGDNYVILIDELDKFRLESHHRKKVDVGNLCEFLDGIMPDTGRIVVITANQIYCLQDHPELLRPGRIHTQIYMGWPDNHQIVKTVARIHPEWALPTGVTAKCSISTLSRALADPEMTEEAFVALLQVPDPEEESEEKTEEETPEIPLRPRRPQPPVFLAARYRAALLLCHRHHDQWLSECLETSAYLGEVAPRYCHQCEGGYHGHTDSSRCLRCLQRMLTCISREVRELWETWALEDREEFRQALGEEYFRHDAELTRSELRAQYTDLQGYDEADCDE